MSCNVYEFRYDTWSTVTPTWITASIPRLKYNFIIFLEKMFYLFASFLNTVFETWQILNIIIYVQNPKI